MATLCTIDGVLYYNCFFWIFYHLPNKFKHYSRTYHKESTKSFQLLLTIHIVPEIDSLFIVTGLSLKNRMKSHCDSNEYGMQPITRQMDSIGYLNKQLLSTICNVQVIDENEPVHCVTCVLTDDLAHSIVHRWYRCTWASAWRK